MAVTGICQYTLSFDGFLMFFLLYSGASIAIDDCYELWESGFVSIPYDFELRDLQPQLQKLLQGSVSDHKEEAFTDNLSNGQPEYYKDSDPVQPEFYDNEWQETYYTDESPTANGSASAGPAATLTAEALIGEPIDLPTSSSQSEYAQSRLSEEWPLRMAACQPWVKGAGQSVINCRPNKSYDRGCTLLMPVSRWRKPQRYFPGLLKSQSSAQVF